MRPRWGSGLSLQVRALLSQGGCPRPHPLRPLDVVSYSWKARRGPAHTGRPRGVDPRVVSGNTRFLLLVAGPTLGWLLLPAETRSGRRGGPEFQHHHGCGRCPGCRRLPLWDASLHYSPCTVRQVRGWAPAWKQKEQTNK